MSDVSPGSQLPSELDYRLQQRETAPLPAGALLRFQQISRGKSNQHDYLWLLMEDGRWYLKRNKGQTDRATPPDYTLPAEPTATLAAEQVEAIQEQLAAANFAALAPYQEEQKVKGGNYYVVSAAQNQVIYVAAQNALVDLLRDIAYQHDLAAQTPAEPGNWLSRLFSRLG